MSHVPLVPLSERIGYARVKQVIAAHHDRLRLDPALSSFIDSISDMSLHEQRVVDFWWIAMGGKPPAREVSFDMVGAHARLCLQPEHFEFWLGHLRVILADQLETPLAESWMQMAEGIASRLIFAL